MAWHVLAHAQAVAHNDSILDGGLSTMSGLSVLATGSFRLQVRMPRGWVRVGNFRTLTGAHTYAHDLIIEAATIPLNGVRVEFLNKHQWKRVWGWSA